MGGVEGGVSVTHDAIEQGQSAYLPMDITIHIIWLT